jgi:hypothetical protein
MEGRGFEQSYIRPAVWKLRRSYCVLELLYEEVLNTGNELHFSKSKLRFGLAQRVRGHYETPRRCQAPHNTVVRHLISAAIYETESVHTL